MLSRFTFSATAVMIGMAVSGMAPSGMAPSGMAPSEIAPSEIALVLQAAPSAMADPAPPATTTHALAASKAKPRATVSATYVKRPNGTLALRVVSNATKVQVKYRNAKNRKKSTTKKVQAGVAVATLPAGAHQIQVRAKATKKLRKSAWVGASPAKPSAPKPTPKPKPPTPRPPVDRTPPGPVDALDAYPVGTRSLTLSWINPAAADLATVIVSRSGRQVCATLAEQCTEKGLQPDSFYTYSLVAKDRAGNLSRAVTYQVKTLAASATGAIQRVPLPAGFTLPFPAAAPAWSPDGSRLAFQARGDDGFDVRWYDPDSRESGVLNRDEAGDVRPSEGGEQGTQPATLAWAPDGSRLAFSTDQPLVADDTNDCEDVYVRSLDGAGAPLRVSTKADGSQSASCGGGVFSIAWEHGGDDLAFVSGATDLVAGDTNGIPDIFVKTLSSRAISRVSTTSAGEQAAPPGDLSGDWSLAWAPAGEKRLAFVSASPNLVASDTNGTTDVFVKTLSSGAVQRASTDANDAQSSWPASEVTWLPGGTDVAYTAAAAPLEPQVLIKTLGNGAIRRVTTSATGNNATGSGGSFSPDGTQVAFASEIGGDVLAPGWPAVGSQVYVKSLAAPFTVSRVSADKDGEPGHAGSSVPAWSPDGSRIAFVSDASNLVPGDSEYTSDIFVKTLG